MNTAVAAYYLKHIVVMQLIYCINLYIKQFVFSLISKRWNSNTL